MIIWSTVDIVLGDDSLTAVIPSTYLSASAIITTAWFVIEIILELLARGVVRGRFAFARDPWRWLDLFVAASSVVDLVFTAESAASNVLMPFRTLRLLRAARALRGLRLIAAFRSTRLMLHSLIKSLPGILNAGAVLVVMLFVMALVGMSLFRGKAFFCNDPSIADMAACTGSFAITGGQCGWMPTNALTTACLMNPAGA